jgi:hypothetical protein
MNKINSYNVIDFTLISRLVFIVELKRNELKTKFSNIHFKLAFKRTSKQNIKKKFSFMFN